MVSVVYISGGDDDDNDNGQLTHKQMNDMMKLNVVAVCIVKQMNVLTFSIFTITLFTVFGLKQVFFLSFEKQMLYKHGK